MCASNGNLDNTRGRRSSWCGPKQEVKTGRDLGVYETSLEDQSGFFDRWMLSYLTPLLKLGSSKVLDENDMGVPSKQDRADRAFSVAESAWRKQTEKTAIINEKLKKAYEDKKAKAKDPSKVKEPRYKEPSIALALVKGFGAWTIVYAMLLYVVSALLNFVPVLILNDLVRFFESGQSASEFDGYAHPWVEVAALALIPFFVSLLQTRHSSIMAHCAVFVRTAVSTMLYRKALRVSPPGRAMTSTGQVVNMMSNDTAQLQRFLQFIGFTATAPLQIIIALTLIFQQVGNATWVGVGFMFALLPVNAVIFGIVSKQRRMVLKFSDLRVKMMNEILSGIRIIKFYGWERPFGKEVGGLRGKELEALTKLAYTSAIGFSLILLAAPLIQPILVFLTYVSIQDEPLTASTAFTTVALFNIMRFPFAFLPMGFLQYIQSKISLRRLERYLDLPELSEYVLYSAPDDPSEDEKQHGSITFRDATFSWHDPDGKVIRPINEEKKGSGKKQPDKSDEIKASTNSDPSVADSQKEVPLVLQNISCTVPAGSLVAVVGSVGSGKSSFISAILGEMEPVNNSNVFLPKPHDAPSGYVSYCAQTPWVVNDTLRGNILFGREFDELRYNEVVEACALNDDISILPAGDMTEIGERGINLSGGQKARTALARALYSMDTKIILMDDPLSAVDAHVGEHIFSKAICGAVSRNTTRVLVTHHVHLLPRCDKVIVLEQGKIKHMGKYTDLVEAGVQFVGAVDISRTRRSGGLDENAVQEEKDTPDEVLSDEKKAALTKSGKKLLKDEEREEGNVDASAYRHYAEAGGVLVAVMVLVIQGIGKAAEVYSGFWLALWSERMLTASQEGNPFTQAETSKYIGIYAMFGFIGILGLTGRSIMIAVHRLRASKRLHDDLTNSVLRAPIAFFDVTPVGRILNRFAADMDKIDLELTQSLSQGISTVFNVLGAVAAMIAATKGTFLVPLVPIGYIYYLIQKWFRKTSTELQRINSIANSPIFADFSQTLSGTSSIRAYGEEKRFFQRCKDSFDDMNVSYLLVQLTNYWLGLRLDILGGLMGAFIAAVAVGTSDSGFIPPGWLGLALSYSIEVTNFLKHGVRMIATIEAQMNSVERVLFYTDNISPEAPEFIPDKDPEPGTWPTKGQVSIQKASMRYRDGPLVLRNISLNFKAGERIGVAGRTGSGKSSLMVMLFRIAEIENDGGAIDIDGIDTSTIGTSTLRLNLSIIPQDPVIFSNTVRYNLDPFGYSSDKELWETLKKVQMDAVVSALPSGLDEAVAEGGENFSQGQRQLICIARSLLRKPKILVMDEATASIDNETDSAIQKMIRENFQDTTILTIAHRLNTIMDSDKILVLDNGRVAEFDSPENLLKKDSLFKSMVEKSRTARGDH